MLILVLGILSIPCCGLFTGIPAIILGRGAQDEIDAAPGQYGGRGQVNAGFICGIIGTVLSVLGILANIAIRDVLTATRRPGPRVGGAACRSGRQPAPDRQVAQHREHHRGDPQRRQEQPDPAHGSGWRTRPVQRSTTQRPSRTTRTGSNTTNSRLLDAAAPTSPSVRSLTARRPPQPGQ